MPTHSRVRNTCVISKKSVEQRSEMVKSLKTSGEDPFIPQKIYIRSDYTGGGGEGKKKFLDARASQNAAPSNSHHPLDFTMQVGREIKKSTFNLTTGDGLLYNRLSLSIL